MLEILQNRDQKNRICDFIRLWIHNWRLVLVPIIVVALSGEIGVTVRKATGMLILAETFLKIPAFHSLKIAVDLELLRDIRR